MYCQSSTSAWLVSTTTDITSSTIDMKQDNETEVGTNTDAAPTHGVKEQSVVVLTFANVSLRGLPHMWVDAEKQSI